MDDLDISGLELSALSSEDQYEINSPLSEVDRGTSQLCMGPLLPLPSCPHYSTNDSHVPMASDDHMMVQPVTADQQNSNGFMVGGAMPAPSSSASLTPHPEYVLQNCCQRTDRENQKIFRDIADDISGTSIHSDLPNNDVDLNRQHSTTSEDNEGYRSDASNLLYHPLNSCCQDTQSCSPPHVHIPNIRMSCESNINSVTMSDSECEGTFVHGESELNEMTLFLHESENEQTLESPVTPPVQLNFSEQLHVQGTFILCVARAEHIHTQLYTGNTVMACYDWCFLYVILLLGYMYKTCILVRGAVMTWDVAILILIMPMDSNCILRGEAHELYTDSYMVVHACIPA